MVIVFTFHVTGMMLGAHNAPTTSTVNDEGKEFQSTFPESYCPRCKTSYSSSISTYLFTLFSSIAY